jgi:hypothetical protein
MQCMLRVCLASGIFHGTLNFESTTDDFIDAAQLLPYPRPPSISTPTLNSLPTEIPVSLALTEFHFVLLYADRVVGICNLDEKLDYEEQLPLVSFYVKQIRVLKARAFRKLPKKSVD